MRKWTRGASVLAGVLGVVFGMIAGISVAMAAGKDDGAAVGFFAAAVLVTIAVAKEVIGARIVLERLIKNSSRSTGNTFLESGESASYLVTSIIMSVIDGSIMGGIFTAGVGWIVALGMGSLILITEIILSVVRNPRAVPDSEAVPSPEG
jgi:hypothetical protein